MLLYLNNADSTKDNPNENYGRELLELHSVSVDGGYNEQDMRNSTLIMTGFGVNWQQGTFTYIDRRALPWAGLVMGFSDANPDADGYQVGIRYLKYLANHPRRPDHLAHKLCVRFVADQPDDALVVPPREHLPYERHRDRPGPAAAVPERGVRRIARRRRPASVRRPRGNAARARLRPGQERGRRDPGPGLDLRRPRTTAAGLEPAGRVPGRGGLVAVGRRHAGRWNTHLSLAAHWWPSTLTQPPLRSLLPNRLPTTHGDLVDALAKRLVFRKLLAPHTAAVLGFLGRPARPG